MAHRWKAGSFPGAAGEEGRPLIHCRDPRWIMMRLLCITIVIPYFGQGFHGPENPFGIVTGPKPATFIQYIGT